MVPWHTGNDTEEARNEEEVYQNHDAINDGRGLLMDCKYM